jgi:hypothetical protein
MRSGGDVFGKKVGIIEFVRVCKELHAVITNKPISTNKKKDFNDFILLFLPLKNMEETSSTLR